MGQSSRQHPGLQESLKRLAEYVTDQDIDDAIETLRQAMKGAYLNYRITKPLTSETRGAYGYETHPDFPTRIAAARLLVQAKFSMGGFQEAAEVPGSGLIADSFTREEVIRGLAEMGADLGDIATFWVKTIKQVGPVPAKEFKRIIAETRREVADFDDTEQPAQLIDATPQPVDAPSK